MSAAIAYQQAFVAFPSKLYGGRKLRGTLHTLEDQIQEISNTDKRVPLIVFLPGSNARKQEELMADFLVEERGFALIAPNTHARLDRPTYESPADPEVYEQVHRMRRDEVTEVMENLQSWSFIDHRFVVLAGLSEGAVAAATWDGSGIAARIAIAWNCEPGYFVPSVHIAGNSSKTPFLNLNGYEDEFFGPHSRFNQTGSVAGHGAQTLRGFQRAKVILYPGVGHRVLDHAEARYDIACFLDYWRDHFLETEAGSRNQNHASINMGE
ncbi:dienelactone hydrolase family protein [Magnetospira sp. QH-2]|uniref:dienelactone hydrolase family protein n=1 Tax=Magnetospira sp. (strain QH-2) TaxID=1288970 RepID=UPI0003E80DB1|nr:dienelactone hydrolase family protein [Magnetospira sp. QH-2]CCQ73672.1 Conserved protein of unknown function [Magnetospira sp. QH-2]